MPNIKPISDLRNYNEVLRDVTAGEPVFLTKNGRGRYAVVDIQEYEKSQAMVKLLTELADPGRKKVGSHWKMWKRHCWGEIWRRYRFLRWHSRIC